MLNLRENSLDGQESVHSDRNPRRLGTSRSVGAWADESPDDSPRGTVKAMAACMGGMADALADLQPDMMVILGDRYEMLAAASAALIFRIPVAHIAGGAVSLGAFDDSIRHAIPPRVVQLGENPARVINTGAIGLHNIKSIPLMSREELESSLATSIPEKSLLVTFHPATLDSGRPAEQCHNLLDALDRHPDYKTIFTYPNNDTHGREIITLLKEYAASHPDRTAVFPSLGMRRYLSALHCVAAAVGNSSSGIVEVPSAGIPTLDIGIRQQGRLAAKSVIHCGVSANEIAHGLDTVLSPEMRELAQRADNPYSRPDTLRLMVDAITGTPLEGITIKPFHDLRY